ncbi:gamma-tubulin complex subunit, putative [Trypanosoma brucei gambiense DAL972]|uniref:Gamma-tubulin complex subunit, putative n=1 Tax=Trypanosoma brucei gambiense (strain MHOM/CI/86/DAL972) TaxID=679716 RepID=D0A8Z7_TRYB9|nr:gamma-tubulin complex subunit, putative [Trypanosoma brucei gambiense DAL972]CBH18148.1 gamma-tubulin complex subunit, putative [Trypanosoma brucei gambiense DAL972]|eukprot:XP_011780412.1 gamma-tubulin complex subunit, putative [Trypanosoma brucei gambiense DAL972]
MFIFFSCFIFLFFIFFSMSDGLQYSKDVFPAPKWHRAEGDSAANRECVQRVVPFKAVSAGENVDSLTYVGGRLPSVDSLSSPLEGGEIVGNVDDKLKHSHVSVVDDRQPVSSVTGRRGNSFELPGRLIGRRDGSGGVVGSGRFEITPLKPSSTISGITPRHFDVLHPLEDSADRGKHDFVGGVLNAVNDAGGAKAIDELEFISDMLFMWMGVDKTKYFAYDNACCRYEMNSGYGTVRQRQAFSAFQECGCLAHQIDDALRGGTSERSFLQQSLRGAVRRHLSQYHTLVASFRGRQTPPMAFGDLVVAFKRVQPKLRVLHTMLKETENVKGGELASKLQRLVQQGSRRLCALLSDVYMEAVSPLLHMTVSSIIKGDVSDPFNEFFVKSDPRVEDTSDTFWSSKFSLLPDMLPTTVSYSLAEQIRLVAKNVSFIRNCCRCKQWHMDPSIVAAAQSATFDTLDSVVRDAMRFTNTAVLRLIREEFHLDNVLRMVNAFLLVGNGDFYEVLIHKLDPVLGRMSHMVQSSLVRDHMQSALLDITPHTKNLDTDLFTMLHCEIVKDDKIIGWDAFVVTMSVPSPLNNIFDASAMKVYRRLFRMMFKVKRAEVALKNSWRQSVVLDRIIGGLHNAKRETTAWREVAADAHLLGLQLNHFVNNLWSYLVAEVSTVSWDLLMRALRQCNSMDDIRAAHISYLQYLTLHSLLHGDCTSIRQNIESVLSVVRQFVGAQAVLTSLLERGHGDVFSIKNEYQRLADDFQREISSLLTTLEEQHLQFDFLNFLLLRLNFNHFYHDNAFGDNTEF